MILTCENCQTRYLLPAHSIGEDGRRVRCKNCGHEWFQQPDSDDPADFMEPDDIEPIPESVKPLPDGANVPAFRDYMGEDSAAPAEPRKKGAAGYLAGFAVFLLIGAAFLALHDPISRAFPLTVGIYEQFGIHSPVAGEGLVFDRLEALSQTTADGLQLLTVSGRVINLQRDAIEVPPIRAALRFEDGTIMDSWVIEPPVPELGPESELEFKTSYPEIPREIVEVSLQFILGGTAEVAIITEE